MSDLSVEIIASKVVEIDTPRAVVAVSPQIRIVQVAQQGPPGTGGDPQEVTDYAAGEALSANKVVMLDPADGKLYYASSADVADKNSIVGITKAAYSVDETATVIAWGPKTNNTWAWDTDSDPALYLGSAGALTQTAPTSGFVIPVGFVVSATEIFVKIGTPITLE